MTRHHMVLIGTLVSILLILHKTLLQTNHIIDSDAEQAKYNASVEMGKRRKLVEEVCAQYSDKFRPEHKSLFQTKPPIHKFSFFQSMGTSYIMCNILKGGSNSWKSFMDQLQHELLSKTEEQLSEINDILDTSIQPESNFSMDSVTPVNESCWPKCAANSINLIQVRHPLERLLSAWRYVFQRDGTYREDSAVAASLSNLIGQGRNQLEWTQFVQKVVIDNNMKPNNQEIGANNNDGQKSHQQILDEPDIWVKNHWAPYWLTCGVCRSELMPRYILHMETLQDDLQHFLTRLGLEGAQTTYPHVLGGIDGHSSSHSQYYYSQLTKDQVKELYNLYKIDHLLFGYSPDRYIDWAQ